MHFPFFFFGCCSISFSEKIHLTSSSQLGSFSCYFFRAGQYKSLIQSSVLSNLFGLHKKSVVQEKEQELLICFSAEISPADKVSHKVDSILDKASQLNSDFITEDHLIVKKNSGKICKCCGVGKCSQSDNSASFINFSFQKLHILGCNLCGRIPLAAHDQRLTVPSGTLYLHNFRCIQSHSVLSHIASSRVTT